MNKKRILPILIAAFMIITAWAGMGGTVQAASGVQVTVKASPSQLSEAGNVELTIVVTNNSSSTMENVTVTDKGSVNDILSSIPPGEQPFTVSNYAVAKSMLGKPITFTVNYTINGKAQTATGSVTIGKAEPAPNVVLERKSNVTVQETGKPVVFTYTVYNKGSNTISNVVVHDQYTDDALNTPFSLAPGKNKQIKNTYTMRGNTASRPSVSFTSGGKNYINTIDVLNITVPEESLIVEVTPSKTEAAPNEDIEINCKVTNQSGQALKDITLTDETGQVLGDSFDLKAGKSTTLTKTIRLSADRDFSVTAKGQNEDGQTVEATSPPAGLHVLPSDQDDALSIGVKPDITQLEEPGTVTFSITVSNNLEDTLTDVVISEKNQGEVGKIDTLPTGDKVIRHDFQIDKDQTFMFTVTAKDENGNTYSVNSEDVNILVGPRTSASPTSSPASDTGSGFSTFITIVIIIVALIIIVGIVLIVLLIQEKRAKKAAPPAPETQAEAQETLSPAEDEEASFLPPDIDVDADADLEPESAAGDTDKKIDDIENPVE